MAQEDYLSYFFLAYISYIKSRLTGVFVAVPSYPFPAIGHPVGVDSPRRSISPSPSRSVFSCLPLRPEEYFNLKQELKSQPVSLVSASIQS